MRTLLVRSARQLLTMRGVRYPRRGHAMRDLGIIPDGSVLIVDGVLQEVGTTRRVENLALAKGAREIDATGRVLIPGFVDAHTHLFCRSAGAESTAGAERMESRTAGRLEYEGRQFVEAMARHGTATLEVKTGGEDETSEMKVLRAASALNGESIDIVPSLTARVERIDGRLDWFCGEWMPKVKRRRLARALDLCWDGDAATSGAAERAAREARALGLLLKVHQSGRHPAPLRLGLAAGAATVDHLEHATDEDIAALAASGTIAVLAPAGSFHAGAGAYAPGRALIDAGCAVALGTDFSPAGSPSLSMAAAISLACSRMQLTPAEAICAGTLNAAHALGCAERTGSLECGKAADAVVLDVPDYRELARHFGHNLVAMTIKRGSVIYERGEVVRRSGLRPVA